MTDPPGGSTSGASKKKKIRGGHKAHVQTTITKVQQKSVDFSLTNDTEKEMLALRDTLKRKAALIAQLDEDAGC